MKSLLVPTPVRLSVLALVAVLAACSSTDGMFSADKVDYKSAATKSRPLEVPPDLSQLARDSRYQTQGGVVSASTAAAPARPTAAAAAPATVALAARGDIRIERAGQVRWLVVPQTPEQLWPQVKTFWEERGFTLAVEDAQIGLMETAWAENRAKLPQDIIRGTLGKVFSSLFDTGERDLFRTRIERVAGGSEIFVSHRGMEEVYTSERKETTAWRPRPSDPQLEAEFLSRMMVALGAKEETPGRALTAVNAAPDAPARARIVEGQPAATLEVDEPFDRAWRRVGLALDRGGFTVEDRDRAGGLYYVRYVDPKSAGKEEPGFFSKLIGNTANPQTPVRYRIALKGSPQKTLVSVLTSAGEPEASDNTKNIVTILVRELR